MITESIYSETERIMHHLMLHTFFMPDIGLFHGQIGIILTMSEYSKHTSNEIYFDTASYLLDNVMEKIHKNLTYSFGSELTGIGWGIEYLIQQGFVDGESVEICEEIDRKIMEIDPRRISDISLDTGIEGLLHYIIYHLQGAIRQNSELPFDKIYLSDIYSVCKTLQQQEKHKTLNSLIDKYITFYVTHTIKDYNTKIIDFVAVEKSELSENISFCALGLKDGLAGKLLRTIFTE